MQDWIAKLFEVPGLSSWGHHQSTSDLNLGLGWIYYGLARVIRPKTVIVIGSYRGFVPLVLGRALADNGDGGRVVFIDPSFVDDFWKDPAAARQHFARFGVSNVCHYLMTTQQFVQTDDFRALSSLGMVFIDGYHSEEQARFDYEAFASRLAPDGIVLLHDSARCGVSAAYGPDRTYERRVKVFVDTLKQDPELQLFDLPFDQGVTLVRRLRPPENLRAPVTAVRAADAEPVAQP